MNLSPYKKIGATINALAFIDFKLRAVSRQQENCKPITANHKPIPANDKLYKSVENKFIAVMEARRNASLSP